MRFSLIPRRKREELRDIARKYFIATGGDRNATIRLASEEIELRSIVVSILISLAIKLVIALVTQWIIDNVLTPAPMYLPHEPGY